MKKTLFIFSIMAASLAMISCKGKPAPKGAEKKDSENIKFAVNLLELKESSMDDYLEFGGDITSVSSIDVLPDTSGKVSRTLVSIGDYVKKDQILCYVDASRPGMNYAASPVKAPISGTITSFPFTIGATVAPSMSVAKISTTNELQIKVNVPERFISRISNKQMAQITLDSYPGVIFNARVYEVSPVLDSASRTMAIKLKFSPSDSRLKVGMYARVKLITESKKNVMVIPSNAIVRREGVPYVFIYEEALGKVRQITVTEGITVDDKTEITDGLKAGDKMVIKGQNLLNDGSLITVVSTAKQ